VTAAAAAGAVAGVPLTHREFASGVVFLTGHERPGKTEASVDWQALARTRMTLCVYMGAKRIAHIAEQLMAGGLEGSTPVAIVSRATWPGQTVLELELGALARGEPGEIPAPALAIIGEVARVPALVRCFKAEG
jgi:siroheme synthase